MERIAVEIHPTLQSRWGRIRSAVLSLIKDFLSPLATVIIAYLVFSYGREFNNTQIKIQETQTNLQIMARFTEMLEKTAKGDENSAKTAEKSTKVDEKGAKADEGNANEDEMRRTLATITIARFGDDALPLLRLALGTPEQRIHDGAVAMLSQIFRSETVTREKLFEFLRDELRSGRKESRRGAAEVLRDMREDLPSHSVTVVAMLKDSLSGADGVSREKDDVLLIAAAGALKYCYTQDSQDLLLDIAERASSSDARSQALEDLPFVANEANPCAALSRLRGMVGRNNNEVLDIEKAKKRITNCR